MVKSIVRWYFKRKEFRMYKDSIGMTDPLKCRKVKMSGNNKLHIASDDFYTYEKPVKKTYYKYIILFLILFTAAVWLGYESYLGWDFFQP